MYTINTHTKKRKIVYITKILFHFVKEDRNTHIFKISIQNLLRVLTLEAMLIISKFSPFIRDI